MSAEENKALILRMYEEGNQGKAVETDEFLDSNYVVYDVEKPGVLGNRESHEKFLTWSRATFSGQTTIEDITAEGDTVVVRTTFHGTQKGEWHGAPPMGQQVTFSGITTFRIANGKIVEQWHKHLAW